MMTNPITKEDHIEFYNIQLDEMKMEWLRYSNSKISTLIESNKAFVGRIWGIQKSNGNVIIRIKSDYTLRLKQKYALTLVSNNLNTPSKSWNFSYEHFLTSNEPSLSLDSTEIWSNYYIKSNDTKWSFVAVEGFDDDLLSRIENECLIKGEHPRIVIGECPPPYKYVLSLNAFVEQQNNLKAESLSSIRRKKILYRLLDNSKDISNEVIKKCQTSKSTFVQGPPGTGKSYLAAQIINQYLQNNKSVFVTALTNRTLIEIIEKEPLFTQLQSGLLSKTNLTSDEQRKIPKLNKAKEIIGPIGQCLFTTYYKLSSYAVDHLNRGNNKIDLLIIEEASQAFLATIELFSTVAKHILVIGDHKQLEPIVLNKEKEIRAHIDMPLVINGLESFMKLNNMECLFLGKTRRLGPRGAKQTSKFYDLPLTSISDQHVPKSNRILENLFHKSGGSNKVLLSIYDYKEVIKRISRIVTELRKTDKDSKIAILTPYVATERDLYNVIFDRNDIDGDMTISTIHKIQGLTVDYCIVYLSGGMLDTNAKLFNVATSRAKIGTLIIAENSIEKSSNLTSACRSFLSSCDDVTEFFEKELEYK